MANPPPYNQGQYPPQESGYPPQQGGMPPPKYGGFFPQKSEIPPSQQGGCPPHQGGYFPQQGGYPPQQSGYLSEQDGAPLQPEVIPSQDDIKEPSAPSFEVVTGYENAAGFDAVPAGPPPPYVPSDQPQQRPDEHFDSSTQITHSEACDALMEFVSQHCCYGKGAAKEMEIKDMKHSSAYHGK